MSFEIVPKDVPTVVVTRHASLVEFLKEEGIIPGDVPMVSHATADTVRGKHVIGVLPLHLAALADRLTTLDIATPAELRGQELGVKDLRLYYRGFSTYYVEKLRDSRG